MISGSDLRSGPFQHTTNHWQDVDDDADPDRYKSEYTYDANGNIERTERWSGEAVKYDDMTYRYPPF